VESKDKENFVYATVMSQKNKNPTTSLISNNMSQENLDGVKQHFRDRMTEKKRQTVLLSIQGRAPVYQYPTYHSRRVASSTNVQVKGELIWSAGEETFSREAVTTTRII
jgi:hypothetical protein